MSTALLFDRERVDEVGDWTAGLPRIGRSALLWIDLEKSSDDAIDDLAAKFGLSDETTRKLRNSDRRPALTDEGGYIHVVVVGLCDAATRETAKVDCLVSDRWLVTIRESALPVVEHFREVAAGSGDVGRLDGLGLLANLLEWALTSYLDAFEKLEVDLEEIDARAMTEDVPSTDEVVSALVEMRREVGRLRRALVSHRRVLLALTRPELESIGSDESAARFESLRDRLEEAVQASRDARETIVGSFDVVVARTGHRTNEVMKVLTLVSVLILPGTLVAGILGMNFKLGVFESQQFFWVALAFIAAIAGATLAVARTRRWI